MGVLAVREVSVDCCCAERRVRGDRGLLRLTSMRARCRRTVRCTYREMINVCNSLGSSIRGGIGYELKGEKFSTFQPCDRTRCSYPRRRIDKCRSTIVRVIWSLRRNDRDGALGDQLGHHSLTINNIIHQGRQNWTRWII